MIDKISFKILTELCQDGRTSNTKLAHKLGINASTVSKRTRAMLENDIIRIRAIPNPAKMGYKACALIALNIEPREIDNVCNKLIGKPHINLAVSIFGQYDILLLVNLREMELLDSFLKNDLHPIKGINHIQMYLISDQKKVYDGMFKDNRNVQEVDIDETNEKLIRILMQNGRANYADISKNLGISISSVSKRIDSLIKESIIQIIGIPNPTKFGYSVDAFITLQCRLDKIDSICAQLGNFPEVYMVLTLMNGFDIMFGIRSIDNDSLYQFLKSNIYTIDGIINSETFIRGNYLYFSPDALFASRKK